MGAQLEQSMSEEKQWNRQPEFVREGECECCVSDEKQSQSRDEGPLRTQQPIQYQPTRQRQKVARRAVEPRKPEESRD